jgi:hypothetical protein
MLSALVDKAGRIIPPWNSFFQQFTSPPANILSVIVGASPFSYVAKQPGMLIISGGTVSAVNFTRGNITISMGTSEAFPVEIADTISVTYSVLPTIKFVPRY